MKSKLLYAAPVVALLLMTTFVIASSTDFSLRSAVGESKNVNINSNGVTGNGYIITSSASYSFEQNNGAWLARTQIGRVRGAWVPVTLTYNSIAGTVTIPELGLVVSVVNLG